MPSSELDVAPLYTGYCLKPFFWSFMVPVGMEEEVLLWCCDFHMMVGAPGHRALRLR